MQPGKTIVMLAFAVCLSALPATVRAAPSDDLQSKLDAVSALVKAMDDRLADLEKLAKKLPRGKEGRRIAQLSSETRKDLAAVEVELKDLAQLAAECRDAVPAEEALAEGGAATLAEAEASAEPAKACISEEEFQVLAADTDRQLFAEDKLVAVRDGLKDRLLCTNQLLSLLARLRFGTDKLALLKATRNAIADPENLGTVPEAFFSDEDRAEAKKIIEGGERR